MQGSFMRSKMLEFFNTTADKYRAELKYIAVI